MHCWARYLWYAVVTILAGGQILVACGQTGDLYLPDERAAESARPTRPIPAPGPDAEDMEAIEDIPDAAPGPISPSAEGL